MQLPKPSVALFSLGQDYGNTAEFDLHSYTSLFYQKSDCDQTNTAWIASFLSKIKIIIKVKLYVYQQETLPSEVKVVYSSLKSDGLLAGLPQDDELMNQL